MSAPLLLPTDQDSSTLRLLFTESRKRGKRTPAAVLKDTVCTLAQTTVMCPCKGGQDCTCCAWRLASAIQQDRAGALAMAKETGGSRA